MKTPLNTLLVLLMATVSLSAATVYTGDVCLISDNNPATIEDVSVSWSAFQNDAGQIDLTLLNNGTDGVVATVYLQDKNDNIQTISTVGLNSSDTIVFGEWVEGGNLPVGNPIGFDTKWSVNAKNPKPQNGVAPDEYINFIFSGTDIVDGFSSGDVKIGMHVISIGEESASYVLCGTETFGIVPEPSTFALFGLGVILVLIRKR